MTDEVTPWQTYERLGEIEARPWTADDADAFSKSNIHQRLISVSQPDVCGAMKTDPPRGYVARNPANHADQWYIAPDYFDKHYRLRTPELLEQIKREGYKPESDGARHLLRHAVLSEAVRKHMGEFWVYDVSLLLSRRPSEAADGARPSPSRRLTGAYPHLDVVLAALTLAAQETSSAEFKKQCHAAYSDVRALASEDGAAVGADGAWVPWKPGDTLPADGVYYVTIRFGGTYRACEAEVASEHYRGWFPHASNPPVAYWSIPLPPPYTPSPPEGGRT